MVNSWVWMMDMLSSRQQQQQQLTIGHTHQFKFGWHFSTSSPSPSSSSPSASTNASHAKCLGWALNLCAPAAAALLTGHFQRLSDFSGPERKKEVSKEGDHQRSWSAHTAAAAASVLGPHTHLGSFKSQSFILSLSSRGVIVTAAAAPQIGCENAVQVWVSLGSQSVVQAMAGQWSVAKRKREKKATLLLSTKSAKERERDNFQRTPWICLY